MAGCIWAANNAAGGADFVVLMSKDALAERAGEEAT
jgi:hypothetical protein